MVDRLRCANCVGNVAYECDKQFMGAAALSLFDEVIEALPAHEFSFDKEKRKVTFIEHSPATPFALNQAIRRRRHQNKDFLENLQQEFDCELTQDELPTAVYEAVEEMRQENPDRVKEFQQNMAALMSKFSEPDSKD